MIDQPAVYWVRRGSYFSEALRLKPDYADALYLRGVAKQQNGDKAGGAVDIAAATRIDSNAGHVRASASR